MLFKNIRPRVLVTGARGNVASRCVSAWGKTMDLRLTDLSVPEDNRWVAADLTEFDQVYRAMEGVDAVIHLAVVTNGPSGGEFAPEEVNASERAIVRVNTESTYNILEAARRRGVRRVVYVSSLTVLLGDRHRAHYGTETPVLPTGLYAVSKLFGEQVSEVYWRMHGVSTICLRLGQPFPITHPELDDIWKTNKRARSMFIEVGDVARAIECAVMTPVAFGVFPVVSASDNQRVDLKSVESIGYVPQAYLSDSGLEFFENGSFPRVDDSVVTHNLGEVS